MTARIEHVVVVVPARDEERVIGRCLAALQAARQAARAVLPDLSVDLVLVLDGSTDGTRAVALGHLDVRLLDLDDGSGAAAARAAGIRDALARSTADPARTWLASTDAGSDVPATWVLDQVRLADAGADAAVGTRRPGEPVAAWRAARVPGRSGRHGLGAHHGLRADAYLRAAGLGDQPGRRPEAQADAESA
ncbi:glycosyltransferase [Cellulomonas sp. ICMP 17802]|uniref:glycosyltransferase n=1 Tax=Cellulomonas sp. ICMP 17802 TaxID=3239199 RepID=UPI00351BA519